MENPTGKAMIGDKASKMTDKVPLSNKSSL